MCSLCCLCTYPATPISNRPPAMCGQHEPPVRPAAPRFESRRCDLCQSQGEDEPDLLTISKWQIGLGQRHKPFLGGAAQPRCWGDDNAPHGSSGGTPPDTPLVTFVVKRKSPGARGGAPASVSAGTTSPAKSSQGLGRSALPMGVVGAEGPHLGGAQRRALALLASGFAGAHSRPLPIKSRRQLSAFALI